ncbi:secreted hydrolase [Rhodococcus wratislaviensis]|uniref:Secreted hydrolase n=1 Tax=Rhodococcus wratislaviensis TaxID=44752 RepID=A0A402C5H0_RHOWR|nr:secreted hydrolase [Rhodococcus wratislaviensis]
MPSCFRSGNNYPHIVARKLEIPEFDDVTCNGASSPDLTAPQRTTFGGTVPAQYDALDENTELVTVTIGGNDVGLFALALSCLDRPLASDPEPPCFPAPGAGPDRLDQAIDGMAPIYHQIAHDIRVHAPNAHVAFVGYPTAIRNGGCPTIQPIAASNATYLQSQIDHLNTVMQEQALASGATYVDARTPSVGHDVCALGPTRWLEGVVPETDSEPLHPNLRGHQNLADQVIAALDLSSR